MKRDLHRLCETPFDLLVIGGGILGACAAWDAALRGLAVALVEKGDFGGGTSSNSLKIIHGGLRYLQHLDLRRLRQSARERSTWLRIAPHLVEPLPVLVPAYGHGLRGRWPLRLAVAVNDLLSSDRNRGLSDGRRLPAGRALSRRDCLDLVPDLAKPGLTGGVLFHDAQTYSSERLVLEVVEAAGEAGAVVANYAAFEPPWEVREAIPRGWIRDLLRGDRMGVRARVIVNAAGPAAPSLAARLAGRPLRPGLGHALGMNLVFPDLGPAVAVALPGAAEDRTALVRRGPRQLFLTPWRGRSLIGTAYFPCAGDVTEPGAGEREVEAFLQEVNAGWGGRRLRAQDVVQVHQGLLPIDPAGSGDEIQLLRHHRIIDHAADGLPGFLSAISVKFTSGRLLAEKVVDRVFEKLGAAPPPCRTGRTPLPGARFDSLGSLRRDAQERYASLLPPDTLEHLLRTYGSRYERILDYRRRLPGWAERLVPSSPPIRAQVFHGALEEMAQRPEDLICRRTELGAMGLGGESTIAAALEALRLAEAPS